MIKKIFMIFTSFLATFYSVSASTIENTLLDMTSDTVVNTNTENGFDLLAYILVWVKDSLAYLIGVIAVGVFLFIGIKIAFARGNPEEFKKAWMQLVYAIVGLFIVGFAWGAVKLVTGLYF